MEADEQIYEEYTNSHATTFHQKLEPHVIVANLRTYPISLAKRDQAAGATHSYRFNIRRVAIPRPLTSKGGTTASHHPLTPPPIFWSAKMASSDKS